MSNTQQTSKQDLRNGILSRKHQFKRTKVVDAQTGTEYEVLQPSIAERSDLRKLVTKTTKDGIEFDFFKFITMAAVRFTVVPGTTERVFEDEDYDALTACPPGGIVDQLSEAASELCNVEEEKEEAKKP